MRPGCCAQYESAVGVSMDDKSVSLRLSAMREELRRFINAHGSDDQVFEDYNDGILSRYELGLRLVSNAEERGVPTAICLMEETLEFERHYVCKLFSESTLSLKLDCLEVSVKELISK